jgi:cytochrome c553
MENLTMNQIIKTVYVAALGALVMGGTNALANEQTKAHASAGGQPSSMVAWTPATLAIVKKGDATKGANLSQKMMCSSCHGNAGIAPTSNWPSLAGQRAEYIYKMLQDYKDGSRSTSHLMTTLAVKLTDQQMADLAAFYASFPLPALPSGTPVDAKAAKSAEAIVMKGNGDELIAPCLSCHGYKGQGDVVDVPALSGQTPDYFIRTMRDYKSGKRSDDIYSRMRLIAKDMSDKEIIETANYFAQLGEKAQ